MAYAEIQLNGCPFEEELEYLFIFSGYVAVHHQLWIFTQFVSCIYLRVLDTGRSGVNQVKTMIITLPKESMRWLRTEHWDSQSEDWNIITRNWTLHYAFAKRRTIVFFNGVLYFFNATGFLLMYNVGKGLM
jgi:hypothetical protein